MPAHHFPMSLDVSAASLTTSVRPLSVSASSKVSLRVSQIVLESRHLRRGLAAEVGSRWVAEGY
jgi:hypothetical protein